MTSLFNPLPGQPEIRCDKPLLKLTRRKRLRGVRRQEHKLGMNACDVTSFPNYHPPTHPPTHSLTHPPTRPPPHTQHIMYSTNLAGCYRCTFIYMRDLSSYYYSISLFGQCPRHFMKKKFPEFSLKFPRERNKKKLLVVLECLKDRAFDSTDCLSSFVIMLLARSIV